MYCTNNGSRDGAEGHLRPAFLLIVAQPGYASRQHLTAKLNIYERSLVTINPDLIEFLHE